MNEVRMLVKGKRLYFNKICPYNYWMNGKIIRKTEQLSSKVLHVFRVSNFRNNDDAANNSGISNSLRIITARIKNVRNLTVEILKNFDFDKPGD